MTENEWKNGQMNVQIVKSQEEMGKVHSYHDTWLHALNIFYMKFYADLWPDLDIGQRSENVQIVISPSIFGEMLPNWYQRISIPSPIDVWIRISDLTYFR